MALVTSCGILYFALFCPSLHLILVRSEEGALLAEGIAVTEGVDWARLYYNVSLIECESPAILEEILATLGLEPFVIGRLSDRAVIVDGQRKTQITRALARRGQAYRIVDLPPASPTSSNEANPG